MKGLGNRQKVDSYMTCSKIVSKLAKQPYTYYQLRSATKIHGDILRRRLDSMTSLDEIIKFKYTMTPKLGGANNSGAYKYDYYLLNWSKPQCKQMLDFYNSYSPEGRMTRIKQEAEGKMLTESEQKMKIAADRREDETEEEYNTRKTEIEEQSRKVQVAMDEALATWSNAEQDQEQATIKHAKTFIQMGHSPLNIFIDYKVNGIFNLVSAVYTNMWEFMEKAQLLQQYTAQS
jgi:hypothetical protein